MKMTNTWKLIISVLLPLLAGGLGSLGTASSITTWYAVLEKPAFNPPNWIFGPVWTILYIFMGIALYLIWSKGGDRKDVKIALLVFGIQLALNTLWSFLFFGMHTLGFAFLELLFLWVAILFTIILFRKISVATTLLLIPYICWVSFAGYLNYALWQLSLPHSDPSWLTQETSEVVFQYPKTLGTKYITIREWPPIVFFSTGKFSCIETDPTSSLSVRVTKFSKGGRDYCVHMRSQSAAGSVFRDYVVTKEVDGKLINMKITLRFMNCSNYAPDLASTCTMEREYLDVYGIFDNIARTVKIK